MATVKKGDEVEWNYGKGKGKGTVAEVKKEDVEKKTQGSKTKRKGSAEEPAVVIKQEDKGGKTIVKSASEVKKTK